MSNRLEEVKKEIKETGISVIAISKTCDCEECKKEGVNHDNDLNDIFDGYVYSIGFHEKGLPEILILAGSNGVEEDTITKEQLTDRIHDAASFINTIFQTRDVFKYDPKKAYGSPNIDGLYWVIADDSMQQSEEFIKHELMDGATSYYKDCQYKVVILKPHIHHG